MIKEILKPFISLTMIIFRIFPVKKNKIVFSSFSGRSFGDNPGAIAKYINEKHPNKFDLVVALRDNNCNIPSGIRVVRHNSIKLLYELATAKIWIYNTRKQRNLLKRKGQFYIQTWHAGIALKKIERDVEKNLDDVYVKTAIADSKDIDVLFTNSDCGYNQLRQCFWYNGNIEKTGSQRLDILFNPRGIDKNVRRKIGIEEKTKVLLYCPTFRRNNDLSVYSLDYARVIEELGKKFGGNWIVLVKLHPNIKEKEINLPNSVINVSNYPDINELFTITDVLITDYSSSMLDYSIIKKPAFIYATDYDDYSQDRDTYFDIKTLPFPFADNNDELINNIRNYNYKSYEEKLTRFHDSLGLLEDGNACERAYNIIMEEIEK